MKNNVRIYFRINTDLYEKIKKEALTKEMSIAQLCRERLKAPEQFEKMQFILEKLLKKAN